MDRRVIRYPLCSVLACTRLMVCWPRSGMLSSRAARWRRSGSWSMGSRIASRRRAISRLRSWFGTIAGIGCGRSAVTRLLGRFFATCSLASCPSRVHGGGVLHSLDHAGVVGGLGEPREKS